jgi:hypothetical protein
MLDAGLARGQSLPEEREPIEFLHWFEYFHTATFQFLFYETDTMECR